MIATATGEGLRCEGVISTSFGCPYEGEVPPERVLAIAERLAAAGCAEVAFGDTTGMANPRQVGEFFAAARERLAGVELTAHFHNTRGQGLANVLAALHEGIESFESSFGELGGCPVPPGRDRQRLERGPVSMLGEMGIETGIDLAALIDASAAAQEVLGRPLGAHVLTAGPVDWAGSGAGQSAAENRRDEGDAMAERTAKARWDGVVQGGRRDDGVRQRRVRGPLLGCSRDSRRATGTNPEELIAAAHAGCFSMAFALALGDAGHEPESIETEARVHLTPADGGGFEISRIDLTTRGRGPRHRRRRVRADRQRGEGRLPGLEGARRRRRDHARRVARGLARCEATPSAPRPSRRTSPPRPTCSASRSRSAARSSSSPTRAATR